MSETTITQYAQPLFYFFLRKTGSADVAGDLAADVLLDTLAALRKGPPILHLNAWVWKVARSRYARWAEEKRRNAEHILPNEAAQMLPDPADLAEDIIRREDMALMRRELAFIRREHRGGNLANRIYVRVPGQNKNDPVDGTKKVPWTEQKCSTSNNKSNNKPVRNYDYEEGESL